MPTVTTIPVTRTTASRLPDFDPDHIVFGNNPTDHMFTARYSNGSWGEARVEPLHQLTLSPLALCLHYGQTVFEGLKAYRLENGDISIFRPYKHHSRFNKSLDRLCMPEVPEALFMDALHTLVSLDRDWIPARADSSLYLRPFVIATEPRVGVKVSDEYLFMVVALPMSSYYAGNLKVKVETEFVRAVEGGTGAAKCGGNYGAAFYPTQKAKEQGYDQILWTDGKHNEFLEESGTMNLMFLIDGVLITPPLAGSILDGVTRDSLMAIAREMGIVVTERPFSYHELEAALLAGKQVEAFGVGTAAVISPIELIGIGANQYKLPVTDDAVLFQLKRRLQDIRLGRVADPFGWNDIIPAGE
ncbi:branched-chain amino acid aminotransferase [Taibaiella koreensis]|uniref:branched-chain amino acid aminotransferase n=1 Tax=Taibaiella koreensis TaxID=1268548 RepID=UPI000E59BC6E|nr:branched-chain amino acid aminotransferase [Taibaiella koreensis]